MNTKLGAFALILLATPAVAQTVPYGSGLPGKPLVTQVPDVRMTSLTLPSAVGSFIDIPLNGTATAGLRFAGLAASGATITYYTSNDATQTPTDPVSSLNATTGVSSPTRTTDGGTRIAVNGHTTLRLQVTTGGTGSITVSYNLSGAGGIVDIRAPLPPGTNVIGKAGIDGTTHGTTDKVAADLYAGGAPVTSAAPAPTADQNLAPALTNPGTAATKDVGVQGANGAALASAANQARAVLFADNYNTSVAANGSVAVVHTTPSPLIYSKFNAVVVDAQAASYTVQGSNDAFGTTAVIIASGSLTASTPAILGPYPIVFSSYRVVFTQGTTAGIVNLVTSFTAN